LVDKYIAYFANTTTYWTFGFTAIAGFTQVEFLHHGYESFGGNVGQALDGYECAWDNKHLNKRQKFIETNP
jgi:hypothetical protein